MKKILYSIIILGALASFACFAGCNSCCNNNSSCNSCCNNGDCCDNTLSPCDGYPFLMARSQGRNSAREISAWEQFINQENKQDYSGSFYAALEYAQSNKPCQIAQFLFGSDIKTDCCSSTLLIQGSLVANRDPKAWLADYFGLSPAFESSVSFCPKIKNVVLDLNWVLNLDKWTRGLYVKLDMPIAWTQYDLGMYEVIKNDGSYPAIGFDAGYMSPENDIFTLTNDGVARNLLPDSFTQAMSGTVKFGDMQSPIKFGKMTDCKLSRAGIADLRGTLGYNFFTKEDGYFGIYGIVAAPTGNAPKAWYLFEPMIGNGKHWELGGGMSGGWIFHRCKSKSPDRYLGVYLDATVSHLFAAQQCRSFDFKCKPGSRYMLLEQMGANTDDIRANVNGTKTAVNYQYKSSLIPAINWSTFCMDVSIGVQADIALKLVHVRENWTFDIGYNFWARSGEKFCCDCCNDCCDSCITCTPTCTSATDTQYAIKGSSYVYGFDGVNQYGLSATESTANIHYTELTTAQIGMCRNPKIDAPYDAYKGADTYLACFQTTTTVKTSYPAVLVSKNLLNMCKSPSAITHKIFLSMNHAWKDANERWLPFLGIGGEVEFAQGFSNNCCNSCDTTCTTNSCNSCNNSCCDNNCCPSKLGGVSQWGLWLKGGVKFD